jgi:Tfp pilus assembly protein PilW
MDYKTASTIKGFTLPEVLVASLLATMIFGLAAVMAIHFSYGTRASENYYTFEQEGQFALDVFSRDVRQAFGVASNSTTMVALTGTNASVIVFAYKADAKQFIRTAMGQNQVLLNNCLNLHFSYYQRSPTNGVYDQFPAGSAATTKIVEISWYNGVQNPNGLYNSADFQSSKVVIRKE